MFTITLLNGVNDNVLGSGWHPPLDPRRTADTGSVTAWTPAALTHSGDRISGHGTPAGCASQ